MNHQYNENILKLILTSIHFSHIRDLHQELRSRILCNIIQTFLNHKNIFKSSGRAKTILNEHKYWVNSIVSLNENYLVSGSDDCTLKVWNISDHQCIQTLLNNDRVQSVIILADGKIAASNRTSINIFDTDKFICVTTVKRFRFSYYSNLLLLSNNNLACTALNITRISILIFDHKNDYNCIKIIDEDSYFACSLINLPNDNFAYSSGGVSIKIRDTETGHVVKTLSTHNDFINVLLFIEKFNILLSGSNDKTIKVWNVKGFECIKTIDAHDKGISTLLMLSGGFFASGFYNDGIVKIWDLCDFQCINVLKGHTSTVSSLLVTKDNSIISASYDKTIIIWNY
jgi:WD40 repeat protein